MAINGFPAAIQNVIEQQNYLETKLRKSLHARLVLRKATAQKARQYFDARIGETKTFTRSNPIAPNATPINPASNTGLDNGLTPGNRSFEQWTSTLYQWMGGLNLNVLEQETLIGDLFIDYLDELAAAAANSLEVVCLNRTWNAYDSGTTFATAAASGLTLHVDNINGFATQYLSGNLPSYSPSAVSATNYLPVLIVSGTDGKTVKGHANVTAATADGTNTSTMVTGTNFFGVSGNLTLDANPGSWAVGDLVVAMDTSSVTNAYNPAYLDGSLVIRPLSGSNVMRANAYQMTAADLLNPSVQIPQAVQLLSRRQVPRLSNGLYGCMVDSTLLAQLYSDTGFQRATMGTFERSPVFANGIIAKGWGVEFVEATQVPVYNAPAGGFSLRHAFCFGEDVISEHPFAGARNAQSLAAKQGDIVDVRWVDDIEFINQAPLDRANEVVKMTYKYVGDFQPGTDKGSNPTIVFTSDYQRYKRGVVIQAASAI